ncbi:MAG: hypothetical protein RR552_00565 [Oscillospiraceae bacterium]
MLESFFGAIFVGLILFGLIALAYGIMLKLLLPKQRYEYYIIIPSKKTTKDISAAAYAARMKMNLIGDESYGRVIVLDTGMNEADRLACLNVCRESNGIYLCSFSELEEFVK